MQKIIYMNLDNSVEVKENEVQTKDVAKIYAQDKKVEEEANGITLFLFENKKKRQVISAIYIIGILQEAFPEWQIINVGEKEVLINYKPQKQNPSDKKMKISEFAKIATICLICFFGSAFTIMAFHNDIGIRRFFKGIYYEFSGYESDGFTVLEIAYSIGLAVGILVFFNHIGKKKFSDDPTPVEVEMKVYESDINNALIEISDREGDSL